MGVEVELFSIVGIKTDYGKMKIYKSKADPDYIWDLEDDYLKRYEIVLFKDNLPDDFVAINDGMGGKYCIYGKLIDKTQDLYDGFWVDMNTDDLAHEAMLLTKNLTAMGIKHNFEDIKLYTFTYFS